MAGKVLGSAHLASESTLEDVAKALRPVLRLPFAEAQLDMFVGDQMVQGLHPAESCPQFTISAGESFGPGRKFLLAMSKNVFDPRSTYFDANWTQRKAPYVGHAEVVPFLKACGVASKCFTVTIALKDHSIDAECINMAGEVLGSAHLPCESTLEDV
ncbi:unnamed protein product, partial [Symbiodinium pilosum]